MVFTLAETDYVCNYILNGGNKQEFLDKFKGAYSEGFDPDQHLKAIGVANQTTMLRGETEEVQRRLQARHGARNSAKRRSTGISVFLTLSAARRRTGRMPWENCCRIPWTCCW